MPIEPPRVTLVARPRRNLPFLLQGNASLSSMKLAHKELALLHPHHQELPVLMAVVAAAVVVVEVATRLLNLAALLSLVPQLPLWLT